MTNKQTRSGESQLNFLDEIIVDNFAGGRRCINGNGTGDGATCRHSDQP